MWENAAEGREALPTLGPADFFDPVIEAYKKHIDRTLLRENLKLTVEQRLRALMELQRLSEELRRAGQKAR